MAQISVWSSLRHYTQHIIIFLVHLNVDFIDRPLSVFTIWLNARIMAARAPERLRRCYRFPGKRFLFSVIIIVRRTARSVSLGVSLLISVIIVNTALCVIDAAL